MAESLEEVEVLLVGESLMEVDALLVAETMEVIWSITDLGRDKEYTWEKKLENRCLELVPNS